MAKGDDKRVRNAIDTEQGYLQNRFDNIRFGMTEPLFNQSMTNFNQDRGEDKANYSNLMGGFNEFAQTGGFTPEAIGEFRARAAAPIRAAYGNAVREVDRARAIQGGSMPGYAVLRARMNRDTNQAMSDASINANAAIAQLVQQGRLAGLQGGSQLYGTTPGWSNLSSKNLSDAAGLNMDLLRADVGRGLGVLENRNAQAQIPGKWAQTFGVAGDFIKNVGSGVAGAAAPWGGA